jgi:CubicO group peptidase (beta-lactamase class C family)
MKTIGLLVGGLKVRPGAMKMKCWIIILILGFFSACEKDPDANTPGHFAWSLSTPQAQGMDRGLLDLAFAEARSKRFVDSLLVIRNGFIVAEEYYNGFDQFRPHNVMSVSKSFLSAVTGIALQRGLVKGLDEKMLDYFPEYVYPGMDARKYDITLRHLLTMRMGIRGEAEDNYGVYWQFYNSSNWIKATIEAPLVFDPGEKMSYNTFQTHLLSAIITKATGESTLDFAAEWLFSPMKIDVDSWERDPQGYYFGGNSMYFTPREMAVLGLLYLNNGALDGLQIIPNEWVELTLSPSTALTHPNEWGAFKNYNYAYLWWLGQINAHGMFMAYGYGGQFVVVFPALDLIVVSTASHQVDPDASTVQELALFEIIASYILPSVGG